MTGQPGVTQSLQTAQPNFFVLPACRYMLPMGAVCGGPGSRACSGQPCLPSQLAGGCCAPGFECRQAHKPIVLCRGMTGSHVHKVAQLSQ